MPTTSISFIQKKLFIMQNINSLSSFSLLLGWGLKSLTLHKGPGGVVRDFLWTLTSSCVSFCFIHILWPPFSSKKMYCSSLHYDLSTSFSSHLSVMVWLNFHSHSSLPPASFLLNCWFKNVFYSEAFLDFQATWNLWPLDQNIL